MLRIREAAAADIPAVAALEAALFSRGADADAMGRMLTDGRHVLLLAEEDGALRGYAWYEYVLDEGFVGNLAAAPDCRRRGVGSALCAALLEDAGRRGLRSLALEVRESNLPARRLYEGRGFQPVGTRKNYYEKPREDAVLLTAFLPQKEDTIC